ncbi:MAG: adenylate/guanylate cyclase domain-containing protein [Chlamydiales bacterium]
MQKYKNNSHFWQSLIFGQWKTIKAKFLHTFLDIATAALIILIIAMLTFFWLRQNALLLAEKQGPLAIASISLESGLQKSLAAIHGWMLVPDPAFIKNYQDAWNNQIWKNYHKLFQLAKTFNDKDVLNALTKTKPALIKLYNAQWQILDIAHTIGNNEALTGIHLHLQPILHDLTGLINGLKDIQKLDTHINSIKELELLDRLKYQLVLSLNNLKSYAMYGQEDDYLEFYNNLQSASKTFRDYESGQKNTQLSAWDMQEHTSLLSVLNLELIAFKTIANQTVASVKAGKMDVAKNTLHQMVIPVERQVSEILLSIERKQQNTMDMGTRQLFWIGEITPWVMTALVLTLLMIAVILAIFGAKKLVEPITTLSEATQKLASHQLNEDLPVLSEDEIGRLTISFNNMRTSLLASEEQTEQLLLNILPASIVKRLRSGEQIIADKFNDVGILFLDIANFTPFASKLSPENLVSVLGHLFTHFDQLVEQYKLEKIKTIGDAYMVAGGAPEPIPNHLQQLIEFGLAVLQSLPEFNKKHQTQLHVRIGLHCGAVIGGVIGQKRFTYDLWGDTVNIASRMESQGVIDKIQTSEAVYQRMRNYYDFEPRGKIAIKGKDVMQYVYLLG